MPDIKIKPQMDQPKVRVVNNTPKDASSILKKEYAERQKEKQPDTKGPVQYATDRVETTGRRSTAAAADGMRRAAKKAMRNKKVDVTDAPEEPPTPDDLPDTPPVPDAQPRAENRAQTQFVQERREQAVQESRAKHDAGQYTPSGAGPYSQKPSANSPHRARQADAPRENVSASPRERGRHKAREDFKSTRQKTRNLAEKERAITAQSIGAKPEGRQFAKLRSAGVKQGAASPGRSAPDGVKQTAAKRAKQMMQRKAQRKMLSRTAEKAKYSIKTGAQALVRGAVAVGRAAAAAVSSILAAGGGLALFLVLLVVICKQSSKIHIFSPESAHF